MCLRGPGRSPGSHRYPDRVRLYGLRPGLASRVRSLTYICPSPGTHTTHGCVLVHKVQELRGMGRCKRVGSVWICRIGERELQEPLAIVFRYHGEIAEGADGDGGPRALAPKELGIVGRANVDVFSCRV